MRAILVSTAIFACVVAVAAPASVSVLKAKPAYIYGQTSFQHDAWGPDAGNTH